VRTQKAIFFTLILLAPLLPSVLAINDYGEDEDYLGQVVDDYENVDNIAAMIDTIHNETLDCMELDYGIIPEMVLENFTLYTESDEGGGITIINATYVQYLSDRSKTRYIYYDFGVDGLHNYKIYGHFKQDYHNEDAWTAFCMMSNWLGGEKQHRDILEDHTYFTIGGPGEIHLYEYDSGVFYSGSEKVVPDDTDFWYKLEKNGLIFEFDVYTTKALRNAEENGDWFDDSLTLQNDYSFRYFYLVNNHDSALVKMARYFMYQHYFYDNVSGYKTPGTYYTINVLEGDPALTIIYNLTIPAGCGATMEFSTDNITWINHNNEAGSDTLIAGYEALDLRDIYNGTIYRRVNMTGTVTDTPRMWQERFVTVTGDEFCPTCEEAPALSMGKYYALAIILLILGILLGQGMRKR